MSQQTLGRYRYFNAPDGKDPVGKLVSMGKYGLLAGTYCGFFDAIYISEAGATMAGVKCFMTHFAPIFGISLLAPAVVYSATNFRGKDDHINYVLGGISTLPVLKNWLKLGPSATCSAGIVLVLGSLIVKTAVIHSKPFPHYLPRSGSYY